MPGKTPIALAPVFVVLGTFIILGLVAHDYRRIDPERALEAEALRAEEERRDRYLILDWIRSHESATRSPSSEEQQLFEALRTRDESAYRALFASPAALARQPVALSKRLAERIERGPQSFPKIISRLAERGIVLGTEPPPSGVVEQPIATLSLGSETLVPALSWRVTRPDRDAQKASIGRLRYAYWCLGGPEGVTLGAFLWTPPAKARSSEAQPTRSYLVDDLQIWDTARSVVASAKHVTDGNAETISTQLATINDPSLSARAEVMRGPANIPTRGGSERSLKMRRGVLGPRRSEDETSRVFYSFRGEFLEIEKVWPDYKPDRMHVVITRTTEESMTIIEDGLSFFEGGLSSDDPISVLSEKFPGFPISALSGKLPGVEPHAKASGAGLARNVETEKYIRKWPWPESESRVVKRRGLYGEQTKTPSSWSVENGVNRVLSFHERQPDYWHWLDRFPTPSFSDFVVDHGPDLRIPVAPTTPICLRLFATQDYQRGSDRLSLPTIRARFFTAMD